jgi:hypothetical protein
MWAFQDMAGTSSISFGGFCEAVLAPGMVTDRKGFYTMHL